MVNLFDTLDDYRSVGEVLSQLEYVYPGVLLLRKTFPIYEPWSAPSHEVNLKVLNDFLQLRIATILDRECRNKFPPNRYPTSLIISALKDFLSTISEADKYLIASNTYHKEYDAEDDYYVKDGLLFFEREHRFSRLVRDSEYQLALTKYFEESQKSKLVTELLDWRLVPEKLFNIGGLIEYEYVAWLNAALFEIEKRLDVPQHFINRKLQISTLPDSVRNLFSPVDNLTKAQKISQSIRLTLTDKYLNEYDGAESRIAFIRRHIGPIIRQHPDIIKRVQEMPLQEGISNWEQETKKWVTTSEDWFTPSEFEKFRKKHGLPNLRLRQP